MFCLRKVVNNGDLLKSMLCATKVKSKKPLIKCALKERFFIELCRLCVFNNKLSFK